MTRFRLMPARVTGRGRWPAAAIVTAGALAAGAFGAAPASAHLTAYRQVNLVSDQPGHAPLTDPDLVNAWGLAASPGTNAAPGSPLWVADNGSDKATLYAAGATRRSVTKVPLTVSVTGAAPTGQVFNSDSSSFVVRDKQGNSGSSVFIFDTENGTIDGWSPTVNPSGTNPSTVTEVARNNGANAVYKGLAIAQRSNGKTYLSPPTSGPDGSRRTTASSSRSSCPAGCSSTRGCRPAMARSASPRSTAAVRDVRQAGRHAARRRRRAGPRVRGRVHQ